MNFISNIVSPLFSFVGEPILSAYNGYDALKSYFEYIPTKAEKDLLNQHIIKNNIHQMNFSIIAKNKIKNFISDEIGVDTSNLYFIEKTGSDNSFSTTGSLKYHGFAFIFIPSEYIKEMENDLSNDHKFSIAHEIGHLMADDFGEGSYLREMKSSLFRLLSYSASTIALSQLFSNQLTGIAATHLLGCGISKAVGLYFESKVNFHKEFLADKYAIKISPEIAKGGIELFKKVQTEHLLTRNNELNKIIEMERNVDGKFFKSIFKIGALIIKTMVTDEGDSINFSHPTQSERIKRIENYAIKQKWELNQKLA